MSLPSLPEAQHAYDAAMDALAAHELEQRRMDAARVRLKVEQMRAWSALMRARSAAACPKLSQP